jgi:hypothetical protein
MSYEISSAIVEGKAELDKDLLKRFVVDEAGGIFWDFQLPFLDVLPKLPGEAS